MKLILILFLLHSYSFSAFAAFPELFGSSAGSLSVGAQAEKSSAANNYYAPAIQGFSRTTQFEFSTFYISSDFKQIKNVTVRNDTNTINNTTDPLNESGNVEIDINPTLMFGSHFSAPLFTPEGPKLNFSVFGPYDRLLETNSGDPYQPRYVLYENRFLRPVIMFSVAQSFGEWSYSLGAQTGFQSNGETYFLTRLGNESSLGRISFNAKPSIGITASLAHQSSSSRTYLAFHEEMKSKIVNRASGVTDIGGLGAYPYDLEISALMFYDPMTFRAGHQILNDKNSILFALEYQVWENYESSTLKLRKNGGQINSSIDYENLELQNIFIPRVGFVQQITDEFKIKLGYFYRPTPLKNSALKNAGNSIDVEKHVPSIGSAYDIKFMEKVVTIDLSYQAHLLNSKKIVKSPGLEDGSPGSKIGSPGYPIGGMIHVVGLGFSWKL